MRVFTNANEPKSAGGHTGRNFPQSPFGFFCNVVMLYLETRNILEICSAVVLGIHKMCSH
jgi:hypothetical protein